MTQRRMLATAAACAALVGGPGLDAAWAQTTVRKVVVRPSPVHAIPEDQAADDANPILNPGLNSGLAGGAPTQAKLVEAKLVEVDPATVAPSVALEAPVAVAAPPADAGPKVAVARRIVDAAGAFDGYMHRAAAIKADFSNGDSVARALTLGAVYQPGQLEQGAIAFAALLALQDPAFVQAVHDVGENPEGREAFSSRLVEAPKTVLDAPAARRAAVRVSAVLGRMGVDLVAAGAAVKQAAYDVQAQGWSKQAITASGTRLETIRAQSARSISLVPADTAHLISDLGAIRTAEADPRRAGGEVSPVVTRGLAVAALAVLGMAGEDDADRVAPLLTEAADAQCIKMAQLNLMQCLSVAGPHYEDAFCLGRHAMMETGQCVATAAGLTAAEVKPATDTRSVFVPIALAAVTTPKSPVPVAGPAEGLAEGLAEGPGPEEDAAFGRAARAADAADAAPAVHDEVAIPVAATASAPAAAPAVPAYSPYDGPAAP